MTSASRHIIVLRRKERAKRNTAPGQRRKGRSWMCQTSSWTRIIVTFTSSKNTSGRILARKICLRDCRMTICLMMTSWQSIFLTSNIIMSPGFPSFLTRGIFSRVDKYLARNSISEKFYWSKFKQEISERLIK